MVLASDSWIKDSNAPFVRSPVVDEEWMRPGHWFRLVLCVPFSAVTLRDGWQKGHLAHKNPAPLIPRSFLPKQVEEDMSGNQLAIHDLITLYMLPFIPLHFLCTHL